MGCHRNHAFSHSPYQKKFEDTFVSHSGGPKNDLTPLKICPGGARYSKLVAGYNGSILEVSSPQIVRLSTLPRRFGILLEKCVIAISVAESPSNGIGGFLSSQW